MNSTKKNKKIMILFLKADPNTMIQLNKDQDYLESEIPKIRF